MPEASHPADAKDTGRQAPPGVGGDAADEAGVEGAGAGQPRRFRRLRERWQIPTVLIGAALFGVGIMTARTGAPVMDFTGALADAEALIARQEFDGALGLLNEEILLHLGDPAATPLDAQQFHLLRGDAIYRGQIAKGIDNPKNHQAVIDDYNEAERLRATLDPVRLAAYADSLISLGQDAEAVERIHRLPAGEAERRRRLLKKIIERNLASADSRYDMTLGLLTELATDQGLSDAERRWIVVKQTELRLHAGYVEEALGTLLRSMQRVGDLAGRDGAELYLLLARTYFELGRFTDALRQIDRVVEALPETDQLLGEAQTLTGRILQINGELQEARDRFTIVTSDFLATRTAAQALLGLAEVEAGLGNVAASLEAYERLVAGPAREPGRRDITPEIVVSSLLRQHNERFVREDFDNALNFAKLAESLRPNEATPPEALQAIAQTHRALGERLLGATRARPDQPVDLSAVDPVTRAEGRAHFSEAGAYFMRHARAVLLTDDLAFGDSLWHSGDSYDRAGELDRAIAAFSEFASGRPSDPRQPQALFRLAQAHMARGDFTVAARFFSELIDKNPNSGEGTRSHVPLAQCYLLDTSPGNDSEAERLLDAVISGHLISPDALEFKDALFELGRLHLRAGRFEAAIRRLTEAVDRFPEDREIDRLRFNLAESHRLSAAEIDASLQEAMPESRRRTLTGEREQRLRESLRLYELVRLTLEARDPRRMSELERLHLRNAMFYRADCAFDLGDFDTAIKLYDAAAQRYAADPASLVAMIQIVNAYVAQGAWREAATANERARQRLEELPEDVFKSPDLPLDRRHMERWLESSASLSARADAGK